MLPVCKTPGPVSLESENVTSDMGLVGGLTWVFIKYWPLIFKEN